MQQILFANSHILIFDRSMMAGLQGRTCWADTAAKFQTLHPHTIRFTYGSAQITLRHAVGLLSPGTPQIQVCCMFISVFYLSSLVCF